MGPIEVLQEILWRHPDVEFVSTRQVQLAGALQERTLSPGLPGLVAQALEIRRSTSVSFMDAINIAIVRGYSIDSEIVRQIMFQNDEGAIQWHTVTGDWRERVSKETAGAGKMHVLSSPVRLRDGSIRHLEMMDFHVPASRSVQPNVEMICQEFGGPGWLLESGRSYHYYGTKLRHLDGMTKFLGRALLFAPITDRAWIAHQLVDGACCLRIAEHSSKVRRPIVVSDFSTYAP